MASSAQRTADDITALAADELTIATQRPDGSLRNGVIIWMVMVGSDLYIRAVKGPSGPWYRGAISTNRARITVSGQSWDVALEQVDSSLGPQIDAAFQTRYSRYSPNIVNSVLSEQAKTATLRVVQQSA